MIPQNQENKFDYQGNKQTMRIGTFYNVLLCALGNGEIESIDEGVARLKNAGIDYYEVSADSIVNLEDESVMAVAFEKNNARIGTLYFKRNITSSDSETMSELLEYTKEKMEQCRRLHCKKLMPVIMILSNDENSREAMHDYYKAISEQSDVYGIKTVFENGTNSTTKCFTLEDVEKLLENSDKLGYILDTGNFWFSNERTSSAIGRFANRIARVHLKDILPDPVKSENTGIRVRYVTLGTGVSSTKDMIKKLVKSGYHKGFSIEIDNSNPILPRLYKSITLVKQAENELQLVMAAEEYHGILFDYAKKYEILGNEMELKTLHMLSVAALMSQLAIKLGLDPHMHRLAIITGLFHDIGRYEQFKRYQTFRDSSSIDHADLSAELLKNEQLLFDLSEEDRAMVITAIRNHNKYAIGKEIGDNVLLLSKMIRDADKIDIFRVVCTEPFESTYGVTKEQIENSEISHSVYRSILRHELVVNTDREHPLDYILSCVAFVFDINFTESREIIKEKNKYLCGLDTLTFRNMKTEKQMQTIFNEIRQYLNT